MNVFLVAISIIEILMLIYIFNRDRIFGLFFGVLFLYSNFPAYARAFDNDYVNLISHVSISSEWTIIQYIAYTFVFMCVLFLLYVFRLDGKINAGKTIKFISVSFGGIGESLYKVCEYMVAAYLWINYIRHRGELGYYTQAIVKENILWYLLLEYVFVFVVIDLIFVYKNKKRVVLSLFPSVLLVSVLMITCISIGNRDIFLPALIGIFYMLIESVQLKISLKGFRKWIKPLLLVIGIIALSQFIRINRGHETNLFSLNSVISFFKLNTLLFQDYTYPGNSLMYCMEEGIINPGIVLNSNICNAFFFLDFPTIAGYLSSNYIAVGQWFGIGGYITVEAYLFAGWIGCIVIPIIIVMFYQLYYDLFFRTEDKTFKLFVGAVVTIFVSLNLVRGQTYILFKAFYMYVVPCILLYKMRFERE